MLVFECNGKKSREKLAKRRKRKEKRRKMKETKKGKKGWVEKELNLRTLKFLFR